MTAAIRLISGKRPTVLEFFAGIGLARAGLEQAGFSVAWANDYEAKKHQLYRSQYGSDTDYHVGDIADINTDGQCDRLGFLTLHRPVPGWESRWSWRKTIRNVLALYADSRRDGG